MIHNCKWGLPVSDIYLTKSQNLHELQTNPAVINQTLKPQSNLCIGFNISDKTKQNQTHQKEHCLRKDLPLSETLFRNPRISREERVLVFF